MPATAAPPSSSKRAEANKKNSQKSTGPTSQGGKDRSRFNALKHGMRAKLPVLPGEDPDAFQARLQSWTAICQPADDLDRFLLDRAVHLSWQLERADRAWTARLKRDLIDSGADEATAIADEVIVLGRRLFWDPRGPICFYPHTPLTLGAPMRVSHSRQIDDPNEPARVVNALESTALGCAWLLDRWNDLRELLWDGLKWQGPDRLRAIRLLGKQPLNAVDDERVLAIYLGCYAMERGEAKAFADVAGELDESERERFTDLLEERAVMAKVPASDEAGRESLAALAWEQEQRLEALLASRLAAAEDRRGFDETDKGERLRRYQLACHRTLMRLLEPLRKRRREREAGGGCASGARRRAGGGAPVALVAAPVEDDATNEANGRVGGPCVADEGASGPDRTEAADRTTPPLALPQDGTNEPKAPDGTEAGDRSTPPLAPRPSPLAPPGDATNEPNAPEVPPAATADR